MRSVLESRTLTDAGTKAELDASRLVRECSGPASKDRNSFRRDAWGNPGRASKMSSVSGNDQGCKVHDVWRYRAI